MWQEATTMFTFVKHSSPMYDAISAKLAWQLYLDEISVTALGLRLQAAELPARREDGPRDSDLWPSCLDKCVE
jgi:hypothetical protein